MDGHGFEISKRAKEVRDRKKNRNTLFDKEKTFGKDQKKLNITKKSSKELKKIEARSKYVSESEKIRFLLLWGVIFVIVLLLVWWILS